MVCAAAGAGAELYRHSWRFAGSLYGIDSGDCGLAEYVAKCKELALYDTGVSAEYGDKLITLSTCEYSAQNGRLVVVAKKVV